MAAEVDGERLNRDEARTHLGERGRSLPLELRAISPVIL
jgi:hypothetical protein